MAHATMARYFSVFRVPHNMAIRKVSTLTREWGTLTAGSLTGRKIDFRTDTIMTEAVRLVIWDLDETF